MKYNDITYKLSIIVLIIYAIYSLGTNGITGLLLTGAITLITTSLVDSIEHVTVIVVIAGLLYSYLVRLYFTNKGSSVKEGFSHGTAGGPAGISKRIASIKNTRKRGPVGVLEVEGFQDVAHQNSDEDEEGESATSTPASKTRNDEVKVAKKVVESLVGKRSSDSGGDGSDDDEGNTEDPITNMAKTIEKFTHGKDDKSNPAGLFKLGEIPSESDSGPIVDTGSTLLKAMNSLKPDQISSMTSDTKKLIETQKGLMSMLQGMRPVLEDGRQLLDTFSNIFGGGGGKTNNGK